MSNHNKLIIPKKINVGFQIRSGTYTGKLAYIIYWDDKGVLRKEKSWNTWRHNPDTVVNYQTKETAGDIVEPKAFENEPKEGFVLNKKAGGTSGGWNTRRTTCRVWDPRDFEFEISVENLLFILGETGSDPGKGLVGEFVYSWDKTELVLLPTCSKEYKESLGYTKLQTQKVTKNDMILGGTYMDKEQNVLIYMGKLGWRTRNDVSQSNIKKVHVFYDVEREAFVVHAGFTKLRSIINNTECAENYAELMEEYQKSFNGSPVVKLELEKTDYDIAGYPHYKKLFTKDENGQIYVAEVRPSGHGDNSYYVSKQYSLSLCDGNVSSRYQDYYYSTYQKQNLKSEQEFKNIQFYKLFLITEHGGRFPYHEYNF